MGHHHTRRLCWLLLFGLVFLTLGALARAEVPGQASRTSAHGAPYGLEELLVVASPLPRPVRDVPAGVDVLDLDNALARSAQDLTSLLRHLPGVDADGQGTRFGSTTPVVRGMGGNRVRVLLDGMPVPPGYTVGAYSASSSAWFAPGLVERIEVLKGPASTLFGSDALGGVVAVQLLTPETLLAHSRAPRALRLDARHASASDATTVTATAAASGRAGRALLGLSRGQGSAMQSSAPSDLDDHLRWQRRDLLLRAGRHVGASGDLDLLFLERRVDSSSRQESLPGFGRRFARTTSLAGDDREAGRLLQVRGSIAPGTPLLVRATARAWAARHRTRQRTDEVRSSPDQHIERRFHIERQAWGLAVDAESNWQGIGDHDIGWGLELARNRVQEHRDGLLTDLATGTRSKVLLGETMPVRDFPGTRSTRLAVYLHDLVALPAPGDTSLTLMPGLRWEQTRISARPDQTWLADISTALARSQTATALSPRLGLTWGLGRDAEVYAQLATGFRSPPGEDLNLGFELPLFNYRAIPNPELQPERSRGAELGLRHRGARLRVEASLFATRYRNLIESRALVGRDDDGGLLFQSRNRARARIIGAELRATAQLASLHPQLRGVSVDLDATWLRGDDLAADTPLDSLPPPALHAALRWQAASKQQGVGVHVIAARGKRRLSDAGDDGFVAPGHAVFDLSAHWTPRPGLRLDLLAGNLFDRTWWSWPAVAGRSANDPMLPLLAGSGRSLSLSLTFDLVE